MNVDGVGRDRDLSSVEDAAPGYGASDGARQRLGSPEDSWQVVVKDVVREAPRHTVIVIGILLAPPVAALTGLVLGAPEYMTKPGSPGLPELMITILATLLRLLEEGR